MIDYKKFREFYIYGMEILISTIFNTLLVVGIALILDINIEVLLYSIFFIPLRVFSGGAHANSHKKCILTFIFLMLLSIFISNYICKLNFFIFILLTISFILVFKYAALNKLDCSKEIKHKFISKIIITFDIFVLLIWNLIFSEIKLYISISTLAIFIQSISLLPILNKERIK